MLVLTSLALARRNGDVTDTLVRVTEARRHQIDRSVELPGTVESRLVSTVATEISGLVEEFPVREGQRIKQNDLLVQLRRGNVELRLKVAEAQLEEDTARKELAERTLMRARELHERGVLSRQQLDDALYEFNAWQGRIERLNAELNLLKDDLERTVVRAPFEGIIVREHVQRGEWVEEGGPVVDLLAPDRLEVTVELPERYYGELRPQSRVQVAFEALPGVQLSGTIQALIPTADPQARTFPVKIAIPSHGGRIGTGMLAKVSLPVGKTRSTTIVPKDAIVTEGAERFIYLISDSDSARRIKVELGAGVGSWVEVEGEVRPGDRVVTRGNERLFEGQQVRAEPLEYPSP